MTAIGVSWDGELTDLRKIDLQDRQVSILPESIGQLANLRQLNLSRNKLSSLPESIGQLNKLQRLDLWGNQLTSIPESIGSGASSRSQSINQYSQIDRSTY